MWAEIRRAPAWHTAALRVRPGCPPDPAWPCRRPAPHPGLSLRLAAPPPGRQQQRFSGLRPRSPRAPPRGGVMKEAVENARSRASQTEEGRSLGLRISSAPSRFPLASSRMTCGAGAPTQLGLSYEPGRGRRRPAKGTLPAWQGPAGRGPGPDLSPGSWRVMARSSLPPRGAHGRPAPRVPDARPRHHPAAPQPAEGPWEARALAKPGGHGEQHSPRPPAHAPAPSAAAASRPQEQSRQKERVFRSLQRRSPGLPVRPRGASPPARVGLRLFPRPTLPQLPAVRRTARAFHQALGQLTAGPRWGQPRPTGLRGKVPRALGRRGGGSPS